MIVRNITKVKIRFHEKSVMTLSKKIKYCFEQFMILILLKLIKPTNININLYNF